MFSSELVFRTVKFDEAVYRAARHILHVDASHGPASVVAHGTRSLFSALAASNPDLQIDHVRLWEDSVRRKMEYNLEHVKSKMAMIAGSASDADVQRFGPLEELACQVASARGLVVSAPMWNYGAPWVLKQYFDCVLHPGLTFRETPAGPQGLFGGGRPLILVTSSGGAVGKDYLTPWLLDVASMMGFDSPMVVSAPNVAHEDRQLLIDGIARRAEEAAPHLVGALRATCIPGGAAVSTAADVAVALPQQHDSEPMEEWGPDSVIRWLRLQGGVTEDGLESIEAARIDAELFSSAVEDDWRNEELGLEDPDVSRLLELQRLFLKASRSSDHSRLA